MDGNFFKNLANDLLTLEVNTIVKENTTNSSMPSTRRMALLDIARRYRSRMVEYGICKRADGKPVPEPPHGYSPLMILRWDFAGEFSFNEIRRVARYGVQIFNRKLKEMDDEEVDDEKRRKKLEERVAMLTRIERQSSNLIGMFKTRRRTYQLAEKSGKEGFEGHDNFMTPSAEEVSEVDAFPSQMGSHVWNNDLSVADINEVEDLELAPEQTTLIRKTWEIGTQKVLLQTVIQIDGDITCYMTNKFMQYPDGARQMLMDVHNNSIHSATSFWKSLFMTVANLAGSAFSSGKKSPAKP